MSPCLIISPSICLSFFKQLPWTIFLQGSPTLSLSFSSPVNAALTIYSTWRVQRNRRRNSFATLSLTAQGRSSGVYNKHPMIGPEPWNSELRKNSCVYYVVTRSTSPPGKHWAPSPAFIHWKSLFNLKNISRLWFQDQNAVMEGCV